MSTPNFDKTTNTVTVEYTATVFGNFWYALVQSGTQALGLKAFGLYTDTQTHTESEEIRWRVVNEGDDV